MKQRAVGFFLLISFFSYYASHGQYEKEAFRLYLAKDGLSNRFISGLNQDSLGYIWISTFRGLNRFDGSSFKQFFESDKSNAIPDNTLTSSQLLAGDELAIATSDGAQIISTKTLQTKNLDVPTDDALRYWSNCARYLEKDADGNYGVSTNTGFYIFSPEGKLKKRFDNYSTKDIGHSWMLFGKQVHKLPNGDLLQENSAGFLEYDRKKNSIGDISPEYPGLKQVLPHLIASRSRIFFLSRYDVMVVNIEKKRFEIVDIRNGNSVFFHPPFDVDDEIGWQTKLSHLKNKTWTLTSKSKGFYILTIDTAARTITCDPKKYFRDYFCNVILSDNQSRLWIGTSEGLFMEKKDRRIVSSIPIKQPMELRITNLLNARDKIFLSDEHNVLVVEKQTGKVIKHVRLNISKSYFLINALLLFHPDTLWLGTNTGLIWMHTRNYTYGKIPIPGLPANEQILQMFRDSKMNIWLAPNEINQVIQYKSDTHRFTFISDSLYPLLKINMANSFAEDAKGNIWIGGDAMARWDCQQQEIDTIIERLASQRNRKKGFSVMNDMERNVWVVLNDDGFAKITGKDAPLHVRSENLTPDYSSKVYPSLLNDKIFMVTNHTIGCLDTRDLASAVFNYSDGVPEQFITSRYFSFDSADHSTWFACNNLICRIPNVGGNDYVKPPALNISEITINDSLINFPAPVLNVGYNQNDIRIYLNAINFTDPGNMRFAYRMNNKRDTNWIDMANQQNILLSNLSPGNYNVEIRLRDFDNRWPEQFKYFRIIVQPPFWKSTWFIIAASLLLLILIYLLFKWRISRIRKIEREKVQVQELKTAEYRNRLELQIKEEELTRINDQLAAAQLAALQTQMNPHFIFNALNSIKRMILDNEKQNASRYLSKFAQMIRMTLNHSKETFITLHENIEYLHAYLEMEQLRFDDSFAFHIETNNNLDEEDTLVPSLMIQPLVENAIWHGLMHQVGEKQISIRFHQNHDNIICSIEDNGIGIHESEKMKSVNKQPHRSVGLDNLRNRIKIMNEKFDMNCTLDIVDRSERDNHLKGTLALLKFKIINQ